MKEEDGEPPEGYLYRDDYDWSKSSLAVVASTDGTGVVLWTAGPHVSSMIEDIGGGLEEIGLDDAPDGISVWEGGIKTVHINTPDCNEWESWLDGGFRSPTDEEWTAIRKNECPWDNQLWAKKP